MRGLKSLAILSLLALPLCLAACSSGSNTQGAEPTTPGVDALTDTSTTPSTVSDAGWAEDTAEPRLSDANSGTGNDVIEARGDSQVTDAGQADDHAFGAPCDSGDDCFSGLCTEHMGDTVCTKTCEDECPAGWSCESVTISGGDAIYLCVSSFEHLCRPCMSGDDCVSETSEAACIDYDGQGGFCGAGCEVDSDCPEGFACQESVSTRGGTSSQCVDVDGVCECSDIATELGLATKCALNNDFGTCEGLRTCTAEGLSACDAPTPAEDVCNGVDDDCDGETDEVDCEDENPCTEDMCSGEAGCTHTVTGGAPCDDGDVTTSGDTCTSAGTCIGEPIVCPDDNPCILEATPNGTECEVTYKPQGAFCDDGDIGTKDDLCDGADGCKGTPYTCEPSACEASSTPNGVDCDVEYWAALTPCDDGDASTKEDQCDGEGGCMGTPYTCEPSACQATSEPDGTGCVVTPKVLGIACDDGELGTKGDQCDGLGACVGTPYTCEPGPCTDSSTPNGTDCDVTFSAEGLGCDDGELNTKNDACDGAGTCSGTPYTCEPSACQATSEPDGEGCVVQNKVAGFACDDEDPETKGDVCDGLGACQGEPYTCEPEVCQASASPNGTDCDVSFSAAGIGCDDGDPSTKVDACDGFGACVGQSYTCEPTQCEASSTPNGTGCDVSFKALGVDCDDQDPTTQNDTCDGIGGCAGETYTCSPQSCELSSVPDGEGCEVTYAAESAACDDQDPETLGDQCDGAGGCAGTPYSCTPSQCDISSTPNGFDCDVAHKAVGTPCDDGDENTKDDQCDGGGACVGEVYGCVPSQCEAQSVPDGDGCAVSYIAQGVGCDDGDVNTRDDACDGSGGCVGTPYTCEPTQCESKSVPDGVGCVIENAPAAIACDDGELGTKVDVCDGFGGCAGTPYTCEANECDAASVPNGTDCTITPKAQGVSCDDGELGTKGDQCDGESGCSGTPFSCTPGLCELSSTPDGEGCEVVYAQSETPCDDANPTTKTDICDGAGGCQGTPYACEPSQCEASSTPDGSGCEVSFKAEGALCDDEDPTTQGDVCDGAGGCAGTPYTCTPGVCETSSTPDGTGCVVVYDAQGSACDDLNDGTQGDQCDGVGTCSGTPYTCEPGICELSSTPNGTDCDVVYVEATAACDDGEDSTKGDQCNGSGACIGTPYTCEASQCEASSTPDGTGCVVSFKAEGLSCDDGEVTTKDDQCDGAGGCMGETYTCVPSQCEATSEPDGTGCVVSFEAPGVSCDDEELTTKTDICDGAGGCSGTPYVCEPTQCQLSSVHDGEGCVITNKAGGEGCDDSDLTTLDDVCDGLGACQGTPYVCAPSQCEATATHNGTGCDVSYKESGEGCDDLDLSTVDDACDGSGGCAGIPTVCGDDLTEGLEVCDDGNTATEACAYGEESCEVCGPECSYVSGTLTGYCGDEVIQGSEGEACDDGNTTDGDGCSASCASESLGVDCAEVHLNNPELPDGTYLIDPDGEGGEAPFEVYCDMTTDGGGWTALINPFDHSQSYMERFPVTTNTVNSYQIDSNQGVSWGTTVSTDDEWASEPFRFQVNFNYDEMRVIHSGDYADGLGRLQIRGDNGTILYSVDAWVEDAKGQSLYILGVAIYIEELVVFDNREDTIATPDNNWIRVAMNGYQQQYDYSRRYVRAIWLRRNVCGDGKVDEGEECDDGNTLDDDGCTSSCALLTQGIDCADIYANDPLVGDGIYTIDPDGEGGDDPFEVYCDMTTEGGGWTLVTHLADNTFPFIAENEDFGTPSLSSNYSLELAATALSFNQRLVRYGAELADAVVINSDDYVGPGGANIWEGGTPEVLLAATNSGNASGCRHYYLAIDPSGACFQNNDYGCYDHAVAGREREGTSWCGSGWNGAMATFVRSLSVDSDDDGVTANLDCDDSDPDIYPGAPETAASGVDSDCDGYVTLPEGSFVMGSPESEPCRYSDETEHEVTLTRSFELKAREVTQAEWQALMGNNPSTMSGGCDECPVEEVNWYEALAYCNTLSAAEGLDPCYTLTCTGTAGDDMACTGVTVNAPDENPYACEGYRLPTEAEWEYAARAGTTTATYNGDIAEGDCLGVSPVLEPIAWYRQNSSSTTHPVAQKHANAWGLHDMLGNVYEWTWDWQGAYSSGSSTDPVGASSGSGRVFRGGGWFSNARYCRAGLRRGITPGHRADDMGFRPARTLPTDNDDDGVDSFSDCDDDDPNFSTTCCGNGTLDEDEECDDNNTLDGDGCSSSCSFLY
ncbi:MAG: SUMF1/EgtB/PvdO family nonheme iron enzyme, partial [Myxococcota bacterium]